MPFCLFLRKVSYLLVSCPSLSNFEIQNIKFKIQNKEKHDERKSNKRRKHNRKIYEYIENESKHISHACIDEVPEDALRADEIEISYTVSAVESKFEFEAEWLVKAFAELTQTHRRILELLYVEEKTPQEAAAILGCKVDNIYNQQYRAFRIIKKIRKEGMTDETVE